MGLAGWGETGIIPPASAMARITMKLMLLEKLQKKQMILERLMSPSATHFQGSAMTAMRVWRDGLCCLRLRFASLDCQYLKSYSRYYAHVYRTWCRLGHTVIA